MEFIEPPYVMKSRSYGSSDNRTRRVTMNRPRACLVYQADAETTHRNSCPREILAVFRVKLIGGIEYLIFTTVIHILLLLRFFFFFLLLYFSLSLKNNILLPRWHCVRSFRNDFFFFFTSLKTPWRMSHSVFSIIQVHNFLIIVLFVSMTSFY